MSQDSFGPPIMILGIAPRSGTNFLFDLLTLHPDANGCPAVYEDYLLMHAGRLDTYARALVGQWRGLESIWQRQYDDAAVQGLLGALGNGLLDYLQARSKPPRLVTKTPSPAGIDLSFQLFPEAHLLVLVRDGRSVVESAVRSRLGPKHGNRYDVFTRQWAEAARQITVFDALYRDSDKPYRLLRYEDLITDFRATMQAVLGNCALDAARYDFAAAEALPVRGSSTWGQQAGSIDSRGLDWTPQEKTAGFAPLERWADWPPERHAMFNAIAGEQMQALGYTLVETD